MVWSRLGRVVNNDLWVSPSLLLLDLMLEFRPGASGSCRISMAFGMLPATFFGEIEVMEEMGICRLVTIPTILALK